MTEKEVSFQDKQGRKIVGTLLVPDGDGPFPAVVVCHGFKGSQNQTHIKKISEEISNKGLVSLRFDFTSDPGKSTLPFAEMTVSYELEVLDQAIDFLKTLPSVDQNKIGLAGHSLGGLVVSWYVANHPEIAALVPLSAVYGFVQMWQSMYPQILEEMEQKGFSYVYSQHLNKDLRINKTFYEDAVQYDMDQVVDRINCPILVVQGTNDKLFQHAQHYFDKAQSRVKDLEIIKGSDHNYSEPEHLEEVASSVSSWFEKTLNN